MYASHTLFLCVFYLTTKSLGGGGREQAIQLCSGAKKQRIRMSPGTSLVVQWLRLRSSTAGGMSWIPVQGIKILPATW